jgi:hypothetical protein
MKTVRKKISDKYYIHLNKSYLMPKEDEWEEVKGEKVEIKGFEGYDFFIHGKSGDWNISEGITGMRLPFIDSFKTSKEAKNCLGKLLKAKDGKVLTLKTAHLRVDKGIKEGIKLGISPRYSH